MQVRLLVNGREQWLEVEPWWTLLDVIRDKLGLTGAKKGCDEGVCGACTVLMNGRPVVSCLALAVEAHDKEITTIEGLGDERSLHVLQESFVKNDAMQCAFCTPGQIVSGVGLLKSNPTPSKEEVMEALSGNICRCGCYNKIVEAVIEAARIER